MSDLEVEGKTVLLRTDYNVQTLDDNVFDDHRIVATVPTIQALRAAGARVVIATHRARPVYEQTPLGAQYAASGCVPVRSAELPGGSSRRLHRPRR